jgi:SAM-dependent methyltransferase
MSTNTPTQDPFVDFKAAQREGWKLFAPLEAITIPAAAALVKFAGITKSDAVLDVGCGTGVAAITAARKGAKATGLDLTPALLERAKYNAEQAGVSIDWHEGDAEALPFADGTFDVVISQFGHMFAPRPAVAVAEMLRVLKKSGRIAFSTWPPELFTASMFSLVGKYLPAPAGAAAPPQWGDPNIIRERLGAAVKNITFDRSQIHTPGLSPKQVAARFEENAAPVIKVVQKLKDEPAKLAEFRNDLEKLVEIYFDDNRMRQDYLLTRAVKN